MANSPDVWWSVEVVQYPTTGTFDILADLGGNTPVGAIFLSNGGSDINVSNGECMPSIGFTDGTNQICVTNSAEDGSAKSDFKNAGYNDEVVAGFNVNGNGGADDVNINFVQWLSTTDTGTDQTGVRLNVGKNTDSFQKFIACWLFAGTDVDFAVGSTALSTQDTWVDETGPGFEPDVVFCLVNDAFGSTERNGFFYSVGIVHNGTSVTAGYGAWFSEDAQDGNDTTKESDTTANHCGMHFTGNFLNPHEVECGQFDTSGMSFRARNANATDDVGWCAFTVGGLQIDLSTYALFTENMATRHTEILPFQPGAMLFLRGVGPGTDGAGDSDLFTAVSFHARNQVTGVIGNGCIDQDAGANVGGHESVGIVLDGLEEGTNAELEDFAFSADGRKFNFNEFDELTHLEFREGNAITWLGWNEFSAVMCDHNLILVIEDPRPPTDLILGDVVRKRRTNPLMRM